ncbi:MAG: cytochrome c family protein [Magnetococcus sp. WYHC-3]
MSLRVWWGALALMMLGGLAACGNDQGRTPQADRAAPADEERVASQGPVKVPAEDLTDTPQIPPPQERMGSALETFSDNGLQPSVAVTPPGGPVAVPGGDSARGATLFRRCAACHPATEGAPAKTGPNLYGILGRPAANMPGFNYSPALRDAGLLWTVANLGDYLADPRRFVPGVRSEFPGLPSLQDRSDVIAFLATLQGPH